MTHSPSTASRSWRLLAAMAVMAVLVGTAGSRAMAAGILPPANPTSDCDQSSNTDSVWNVNSVDACRAKEGIGPLMLPSNWTTLAPVEQGFVLINLERVNRGLPPIAGLSASLDTLAADGADKQSDPPLPSSGEGGGIWAGGGTAFGADMMWLYDDGAGGLDANEDCVAGRGYCWAHRDIILGSDGGGTLVSGGGFSGSNGFGSFAYLILSHYSTSDLSFTWAGELRYFPVAPQIELLGSAAAVAQQQAAAKQIAQTPVKLKHHRRHQGSGITVRFI